MMQYEILCPPLTEPMARKEGLADTKACLLWSRKAFLKIKGGRLSEAGFLREVHVAPGFSLYSGTWGLVKATLDLIRKGKIGIEPLAGTETETEKPITEKQRKLILSLLKELNIQHPIPGSRKDASMLIDYLLSRKRAKKKKKATEEVA